MFISQILLNDYFAFLPFQIIVQTRKDVNFGKPKFVYPCS